MNWFMGAHGRPTDVSAEQVRPRPHARDVLTRSDEDAGVVVRKLVRAPSPDPIAAEADAAADVKSPSRLTRLRRTVLDVPVGLLAGDLVALLVAFAVVGFGSLGGAVFAATTLLVRVATRHYRVRLALLSLDEVPRTVATALSGVGAALCVQALVDDREIDAALLLVQAAILVVVATVAQAVVFAAVRRARRQGNSRRRRTLVVGGGRVATALVDTLFEHPELGLSPVAVAGRSRLTGPAYARLAATGLEHVAETVVRNRIDTTILALEDGDAHIDTVITLHQTGTNVLLVPPMFEMHHDGPYVERVRGIPLVRLRSNPTRRLSWWVKRSFDAAVAALTLTVLAVPLAVVAIAILVDSGRPVLFWQERVGLDGHLFRLAKFRSMRPESERESQTQWNIAADPRVSPVGRLLRRTSVDELPQLWNILRGQMSLVGPRPERPGFVEQFSRQHERYWARHRVPVGLTGLAQVNGLRGDTSILERARYDNYYIANWSLWLDVKIMLLTVREVLGGRGR